MAFNGSERYVATDELQMAVKASITSMVLPVPGSPSFN